MGYLASMRIWRGNSEAGQLEEHKVEVGEGEVVLDVIHRLQATEAPDLAVRWNCKAGKCGSCSAEINGKPSLMCMTRMNTFAEDEEITVTPLRAFPVIKDLVADVSFNYKKAREIPAFKGPDNLKPGEYRMEQVDSSAAKSFVNVLSASYVRTPATLFVTTKKTRKLLLGLVSLFVLLN